MSQSRGKKRGRSSRKGCRSSDQYVLGPPIEGRNRAIKLRGARAAQVARWFDLPAIGSRRSASSRASDAAPIPAPEPGQIMLIAGPSGAGKSSLLRRLKRQTAVDRPWIDLDGIALPKVPLAEIFGPEIELRQTLHRLSRVGLSEAWSYLRTPDELSEGQRWRLRLALAFEQASRAMVRGKSPILGCDEFGSILDRITALIIARDLRRRIDELKSASAIVATAHDDVEPALSADTIVLCDFGKIEVCGR